MPRPLPQRVIWITTDHMRWDFIAAHGVHDWLHTPNLDRLVAGGVSFDRCFCNNPLCMPSRCSFMTGTYPQQCGVVQNGQELDPAFTPTVAQCFSQAGYRTTQIGKLHFENHQNHDLDPRPRHGYGFDVMELSEEPGCYEDAYRTWLRGEYPELVETFTVARPLSPGRHRERDDYTVLDAPWQASHSGFVGTEAIRHLGSWGRTRGRQFFHLGFYAPHPPFNPTREMFAPYEGVEIPPQISRAGSRHESHLDETTLTEYRRHFAAMVTGVDLAVGALLDDLAAHDELDDTLIVFGSDHGDLAGDHGGTGKGASYYEGIMRLPWVVHWPQGLGAGGMRVPGLVEMVDVLPTLLGLCGLPVPPAMQGRDYSDALRAGRAPEGRRDVYAVHGGNQLMLRGERWKYLRYQSGDEAREILYDLEADPDELHDLAGDPAHAAVLAEQRDRLLARHIAASTPISRLRGRF